MKHLPKSFRRFTTSVFIIHQKMTINASQQAWKMNTKLIICTSSAIAYFDRPFGGNRPD